MGYALRDNLPRNALGLLDIGLSEYPDKSHNFRNFIFMSSHFSTLYTFFPRHPMVFFISTSTRQFLSWEGLISSTTFLWTRKLTWQVEVKRCKKLHATVWQKLITVAKGKAKIEMSPFSWLYKFPLKHI